LDLLTKESMHLIILTNMQKSIKKIIIGIACGMLFATIGFVLFTLLMYCVSDTNSGIFSDVSRSIHDYFSVFSYALGIVGAIFGAIILLEFIGMFFWSGFWLSEKMFFRIDFKKS